MKKYGMIYVKNPEIVFRTQSRSLEEAINYFASIKQLPRKKFLSLFRVSEIEG